MDVQVTISRRPIPLSRVISSVLCDSAGGTAIFIGTVRKHSTGMRVMGMEIEAAEDMAKEDLERIVKAAAKKFNVSKVSVHHRVGAMKVGDAIVAIAVSAIHRMEAFAACMFIIDELKKSTPIWKKELGRSKARWVEPER